MKRLKVFTNHYYPENFKINEITEYLSREYHVEVITQIPNYPMGSYFEGYGLFKNRKSIFKSNLRVKRLFCIPRKNSAFFLSLNYLSYLISSTLYSLFTRDRSDVVLIYSTSPLFIGLSGIIYAWKSKANKHLYLLDIWPDVLFSMVEIRSKVLRNFLTKLSIKIYQSMDKIFISSLSFKEVLIDYGVEEDKIYYLPQHADFVEERQVRPFNSCFSLVFTGNIGQAQGLDVLIDLALMAQSESLEFLVLMVGDGRYLLSFQEKIRRKGVENYFRFLGRVKEEEVAIYLNKADFAFVSLADDKSLEKTLPAKVQNYMAYGIPILASAGGETKIIINRAASGLVSRPGDAEDLFINLKKAMKMPFAEREILSKNAYNYSKNNFSKEKVFSKLSRLIKDDMNV